MNQHIVSLRVSTLDKKSYDLILRHVYHYSMVCHQIHYKDYGLHVPQDSLPVASPLMLALTCIRTKAWCLLYAVLPAMMKLKDSIAGSRPTGEEASVLSDGVGI